MNVFIQKANNCTKDNEFRKEKFLYDKEHDVYVCPAGNELSFFENTSKNGMKYRKYKCSNCNSCKYKNACTSSVTGRTIRQWEYEEFQNQFSKILGIIKQRRYIVAHPFGTVKESVKVFL